MVIDSLSSSVPSWLLSLTISVLGTLTAFAIWNWFHSPHLVVDTVSRIPVEDPDNQGNTQYSIRVTIRNIGTRVAKNCDGTIDLRVKQDGDVVRSLIKAPWLPIKSDLIVDDEATVESTTIPAGRTRKLELMRQYRKKQLRPNAIEGGKRFVRTSPDSDVHTPINEPPGIAFLESSRSGGRVAQTYSSYDGEDVKDADWDSAILRLYLEAEAASPLEVYFTCWVDDDGWFHAEARPQKLRRRVVTNLYRALGFIR